jgi:hypothetical protein
MLLKRDLRWGSCVLESRHATHLGQPCVQAVLEEVTDMLAEVAEDNP